MRFRFNPLLRDLGKPSKKLLLSANFARPCQGLDRQREQILALRVQSVGGQAKHIQKAEAEFRQARIGGQEGMDFGGADRQQLRIDPGAGRAELARQRHAQLAAFLIGRALQIFIAFEIGIVICPLPSGPGTIILEPWREIWNGTQASA